MLARCRVCGNSHVITYYYLVIFEGRHGGAIVWELRRVLDGALRHANLEGSSCALSQPGSTLRVRATGLGIPPHPVRLQVPQTCSRTRHYGRCSRQPSLWDYTCICKQLRVITELWRTIVTPPLQSTLSTWRCQTPLRRSLRAPLRLCPMRRTLFRRPSQP
jgi:hypothetical protein